MKKLTLLFAFLILSAITSQNLPAQLPPTGYIGLYADENHSDMYVDCVPFTPFYMWIWCLPGQNGQIAAEYAISYPANVIPGTVTANDHIPVSLGNLEAGISYSYTVCQWDWHWDYKQLLYLTNTDQSEIEIVAHPDIGTYQFASCQEGFPIEPCTILNDLYIHTPHCKPPLLDSVTVHSPTVLDAIFTTGIEPICTPREKSHYHLHPTSDPTDTIPLVSVELPDYHIVRMVTYRPLQKDTCYTLSAQDLCGCCGVSEDSSIEFQFSDMPDLPDLTIKSYKILSPVRENCRPYPLRYEIANHGYQPAGPFRVMVDLNINRDVPMDSVEYDGLLPGETLLDTVSITIPPDFEPDLSYRIQIDDLEAVTEITEFNNILIKNFRSYSPKILSVTDVPDDGGGRVQMEFSQCWGEYAYAKVTSYQVLRRIDPPPSCLTEVPDGWEIVDTVQANNSATYTTDVPTVADSTGEHGIHWSVYKVRGVRPATDSTIYYVSCPDSGYSVNDGAVATLLSGFRTTTSGASIRVSWELNHSSGDYTFRVYRKESGESGFSPLSGTPVNREGRRYSITDEETQPGTTYRYRVEIAEGGMLFETGPVSIPELPLTLHQNVPNPFNPSTVIPYYLPRTGRARLSIYDTAGRLVVRLVDGVREAGDHRAVWDGRNHHGNAVDTGVYFVRLVSNKEALSSKIILIR